MTKLRKLGLAALATTPLLAGAAVFSATADAAGPSGPDTCLFGYVWRETRATDRVCVTPATRTQAADDNAAHASRVQPGGGAYGPNTCRPGFVWRDAYANDQICVTPETRTQTAADNAAGNARRALDTYSYRIELSQDYGVDGTAELYLNPNGAYTLKAHLENERAVQRKATVKCSVTMLGGDPLSWEVSASFVGKIKFWERDRLTADPVNEGYSHPLVTRWAEVAPTKPSCRLSASIS